ncbi:MAG TPA: PHP domain-containing protein [bacterium]|nr:PHP domain-containing protein [bacterium]
MRIIADLHTHTIVSGHAFGTLAENCAAAAARGLQCIATTDHGPAIPGAPTALFFRCATLVPRELHGVQVLAGAEINIIDADGNLDLEDNLRAGLDFALIGFHPYTCYATNNCAANTAALLAALARPGVDCVAHADDHHFPVDLEAVVPAARRAGVIFEINNRSFIATRKGDGSNVRRLAALCRQHDLPVVVTSDAHNQLQIGCVSQALAMLAEVSFPQELVLNADPARLQAWLAPRHPHKRTRELVS